MKRLDLRRVLVTLIVLSACSALWLVSGDGRPVIDPAARAASLPYAAPVRREVARRQQARPPRPRSSPAPPGAPRLRHLEVSTGRLNPPFDPEAREYFVDSLNALRPIAVTATALPGTAIELNGHPCASGVPQRLRLAPGEGLRLTLRARDGKTNGYSVSYLPPDFSRFTIWKKPGAAVPPGRIFLDQNFGGPSYAALVDTEGRVLYYTRHDGQFTMGFRPHRLPGGRLRYSYFLSEDGWNSEVTMMGRVQILDEDFREVQSVRLLPFGGHPGGPIENHEFVMLGDGHHLVTAYQEEVRDLSRLDPSWSSRAPVMAGVIQEVVGGRAVWEWRSTDHPQLFRTSVEGNSYGGDLSNYAHLNSVAVDPTDGNLLVSFRNQDAVLKLDRKTGQVLWTLGGPGDQFGLSAEQRPSRQHHATRTREGRILLFDNGNSTGRTRVLEYDLDEAHRKLRGFREVFAKDPAFATSTIMGSSQELGPDTYLVGWGGLTEEAAPARAPFGPAASIIQDGREIWSLKFLNPATFSYRVFLDPPGARPGTTSSSRD